MERKRKITTSRPGAANLPEKEGKMQEYKFTNELNEKAMEVYKTLSFVFYKEDGVFYFSAKGDPIKYKIGTLEHVESFILQFA